MNVLLSLSENAYNNLIARAQVARYIRTNRWSLGFGTFVDKLAELHYTDTRPDYLKEWKPNGHNIWVIPENSGAAQPHMISLDDLTLIRFVNIAFEFDILRVTLRPNESITTVNPKTDYIVHFKSNQTPIMIASAVLEAIGTDLLTPIDYIPIKTWSTKEPRIKRGELIW